METHMTTEKLFDNEKVMINYLVKGQRVIPHCLLEAGFKFRYSNIEEALKNIILDE